MVCTLNYTSMYIPYHSSTCTDWWLPITHETQGSRRSPHPKATVPSSDQTWQWGKNMDIGQTSRYRKLCLNPQDMVCFSG